MGRSDEIAVPVVPVWLKVAGSLVIIAHMVAFVALSIAAPSGPWPGPMGADMGIRPPFAQKINEVTANKYLAPLRMTHNYHFRGNRPGVPGVYFKAILKDKDGKEMKTLRFPDEDAGMILRHRQLLLAQLLADDQPLPPREGEKVAAPNQDATKIKIWDMVGDFQLKLRAVPEHLIARDRPVFVPSEWSLVLVRSFGRYLCREHGAASVELIRYTKEPLPPWVADKKRQAPRFPELVSNFGEVKGE